MNSDTVILMLNSQIKKFIMSAFLAFPLFCFGLEGYDEKNVEKNSQKNVPEKKIEKAIESKVGSYGYISFTILPGFKSIRLDRETVVGMSENDFSARRPPLG